MYDVHEVMNRSNWQSDPNMRKRANHNETEKRRIKTMNNSIDELRNILTVRFGVVCDE